MELAQIILLIIAGVCVWQVGLPAGIGALLSLAIGFGWIPGAIVGALTGLAIIGKR